VIKRGHTLPIVEATVVPPEPVALHVVSRLFTLSAR
jgi:hypothetical protein